MPLIIQTTGDGSHTLFSEEFNEIYHSRHGAWQESQHVFIAAGLKYCLLQKKRLNILEVGFGTGLNAIMTMSEVLDSQCMISYLGIEPHPINMEIIEKMNYTNWLITNELQDYYLKLHQADWQKVFQLNQSFRAYKFKGKLTDFFTDYQAPNPDWEKFDLVYFDAFAPTKQPEMWTTEVFSQLKKFLHPQAILVTYCAKGQLKRDLKSAAYQIEELPGPPGKREMIRALSL
jgi:tRNA U34 5-methylaminomethyl-2-thiouridine-forming methyltransferase MnmC